EAALAGHSHFAVGPLVTASRVPAVCRWASDVEDIAPPAVAQIRHPAHAIEKVMDAQGPAAQPRDASVPGADRLRPLAPAGDLRARIGAWVDVPHADGGELLACRDVAGAIPSVPLK